MEAHTPDTVRQIGISNIYDAARLKWLIERARVRPAVVQNRFYRDTEYDVAIREICKHIGAGPL